MTCGEPAAGGEGGRGWLDLGAGGGGAAIGCDGAATGVGAWPSAVGEAGDDCVPGTAVLGGGADKTRLGAVALGATVPGEAGTATGGDVRGGGGGTAFPAGAPAAWCEARTVTVTAPMIVSSPGSTTVDVSVA